MLVGLSAVLVIVVALSCWKGVLVRCYSYWLGCKPESLLDLAEMPDESLPAYFLPIFLRLEEGRETLLRALRNEAIDCMIRLADGALADPKEDFERAEIVIDSGTDRVHVYLIRKDGVRRYAGNGPWEGGHSRAPRTLVAMTGKEGFPVCDYPGLRFAYMVPSSSGEGSFELVVRRANQ